MLDIERSNLFGKFVFVLMPFDDSFNDIYQLGIKQACKELKAYCERVDEQHFEGSILERIYNQIIKADLIIADLTNKNPNVFYETGYAHALGKKVILITQNVNDIPFDMKHYTHIIYEGKITLLREKLYNRIDWYFRNPNDNFDYRKQDNLEIYVEGKTLSDNLEINIELEHEVAYYKADELPNRFTLHISFHNSSNTVIDNSYNKRNKYGLICDRIFIKHESYFSSLSVLPNNEIMYGFQIDSTNNILPGGWESINLTFLIDKSEVSEIYNKQSTFIIRKFSEVGYKDYNFIVNFLK